VSAIGNGWNLSIDRLKHASSEMWAGTRQLPKKVNASQATPATISAVMIAEGPGIGITRLPWS
jgi:hypothetical protein